MSPPNERTLPAPNEEGSNDKNAAGGSSTSIVVPYAAHAATANQPAHSRARRVRRALLDLAEIAWWVS